MIFNQFVIQKDYEQFVGGNKMIFTKKIIKYGTIKWKRKFAFLPVEIKLDEEKGVKTIAWLEFYEESYKYCGTYLGWMRSHRYRLINE